MKRGLCLVLFSLLTGVLVLTSCAAKTPETPSAAKTETTQTAPPPKPEPIPASFSVSGLTITPGEVTTGSKVTIEVLVTNNGELSGTYDVVLKLDGTVEATQNVILAGGASQNVTFTTSKAAARAYAVSIGELAGSFVVKALPPPPSAPSAPPATTQSWPEYVNSAYGWSVSYPSSLTFNSRTYAVTVNSTDPARVQIVIPGATGGSAAFITISSSLGDYTRFSRDDLVNHYLLDLEASLKKQGVAMTITSRGLISLPNDITAADLLEEEPASGKARLTFVATDKQYVLIRARTSTVNWNSASQIFDKIIRSFTVKKEG